jgi:hypothetical protein
MRAMLLAGALVMTRCASQPNPTVPATVGSQTQQTTSDSDLEKLSA